MQLNKVTPKQKKAIKKFHKNHQNNIGETEDIEKLHSEFAEFLKVFCDLDISEFDKFQRQKLGRYFSPLDDYFKLWLNARCVYATSHIS
ncbi:hypothetical protein [Acinetobacter sp.]|uniref:hypothetical protein n=1 Tax=Acinetobacter sp. TaxID=472 RepID=UPI0028A712AB|nr:hypothetical protein [Acinetobacter sp.]